MNGKDIAVLIVRQVRHQSTRASLAQVSKNYNRAVRETIEYFLRNGGIASFCLNGIVCNIYAGLKFDVVEIIIDDTCIATENNIDYYQNFSLKKQRRNQFSITVNYSGDREKGYICFKKITLANVNFRKDTPVIVTDLGLFRIAFPITLLPEK